jgi:tetratricopeptide (TPR) repeat protein
MTAVNKMRSPRQYFSERYPWLKLADSVAVAVVLVLVIVAIWPRSRLVIDLVLVTAIPGLIAAIVWGLTYWQKARVQVGRLKLRYKSVRRIAGITAIFCLPFLLLQQASIYLQGPNILRETPPEIAEASAPYPDVERERIRLVFAIAHLEGDKGQQLEARIRDALSNIDPRLHVTPVILNSTVAVSGRPQGLAHLDALNSVTNVRVEALIWGGVGGASPRSVGPLYETKFGSDAQFGGVYLPSDFKLPELPPDELCKVIRLIVATQSAESMRQWMFKFGDALEPIIRETRALADDPAKSGTWTADARARVNLAIGIASTTSGGELKSEDSLNRAITYLRRAQADWTRERNPLEWAMAQLNLGEALSEIADLNVQVAPLQEAAAAYKDALAVYQQHSDSLDSATVQLQLGRTFQQIAHHEAGTDSLHQAEGYSRGAAKSFDVKFYPMSWAAAQTQLGSVLTALADREDNPGGYDNAIESFREALKVYTKQSDPMLWADAQTELAEALELRGGAHSNVEDLKESVAITRQTLDGFPREWDRRRWAGMQAVLGNELLALNDVQPNPGYPVEAAKAFRASLEEQSRERDQISWATLKAALGNALDEMGESTNESWCFEQAIQNYNDALEVFRPDRDPIQWGRAKSDLGDALSGLGMRGPGVKYLQEAVDNYNQALTVLTKDKLPGDWKKTQNNLSIALDALHQRGWNGG